MRCRRDSLTSGDSQTACGYRGFLKELLHNSGTATKFVGTVNGCTETADATPSSNSSCIQSSCTALMVCYRHFCVHPRSEELS